MALTPSPSITKLHFQTINLLNAPSIIENDSLKNNTAELALTELKPVYKLTENQIIAFNVNTKIAANSRISANIYTVKGSFITHLPTQDQEKVYWNTTEYMDELKSGVYVYEFKSNNAVIKRGYFIIIK